MRCPIVYSRAVPPSGLSVEFRLGEGTREGVCVKSRAGQMKRLQKLKIHHRLAAWVARALSRGAQREEREYGDDYIKEATGVNEEVLPPCP
jgi:hypothetical protein